MPAKGKSTHGTLHGNAKQFGNSQGGGRSKRKPGGPDYGNTNTDASNGQERKRSSRTGADRHHGTVPKDY